MSDSVKKKPRSEKQIIWARELGKRSSELKKAKKKKLTDINESQTLSDVAVRHPHGGIDSNNNPSNSSNAGSNYKLYITIGLVTVIILSGVIYKSKFKSDDKDDSNDNKPIIPENKSNHKSNENKSKILLMD